MSYLIGTLATDVIKVGIAAGGSISFLTLISSIAPALTSFAIGPIVIVVAVGVATGLILNKLDSQYNLTKSLIDTIDSIGDKIIELSNNAKEQIEYMRNHLIIRKHNNHTIKPKPLGPHYILPAANWKDIVF